MEVFSALERVRFGSRTQNLISTIMFMILLDVLRFYKTTYLSQEKRYMVISTKRDMYELLIKFPNNVRPRILESQEKL